MCRLYGFRSSYPRKIECELIRAENSLLAQSLKDEHGNSHPDGWGLAIHDGARPHVVRQARAASESMAFRWVSAQVHSRTVLAHVRRATFGDPRPENTHPFSHDRWLFAHNGTLGAFPVLRERMLAATSEIQRRGILGQTDSEHVFHFLLARAELQPERPLLDAVREGVTDLVEWSRRDAPEAEIGLNILLTDGQESVGVRYGRSLWYTARDRVHPCEVCGGALHVEGVPPADYHAIVVASEPITRSESWESFAEGAIFRIDPGARLHVEAL
ncbi:MAG: class II glutamine amidotransferase [Gammaproteobacteria bacterium]|nr:class II glutamine amidotransferase [Gammaproteobacteria bacterium]